MLEYAALVASPRALPDGLIIVFQHPFKKPAEEVRETMGLGYSLRARA
jgi:hypothetical protein